MSKMYGIDEEVYLPDTGETDEELRERVFNGLLHPTNIQAVREAIERLKVEDLA